MAPIVAALMKSGLTLLGNAILSKGKEVVEEKLGVKIPDDPSALTPGQLESLRALELEHEEFLVNAVLQMRQLELEEKRIDNADTANARHMQEAALLQADVFSKRFVYYFAVFWALGACIYIGFITFGSIPEKNMRFADTILGFILGTVVATIIQFFYGTSRSSQGKDRTIQDLVTGVKGVIGK